MESYNHHLVDDTVPSKKAYVDYMIEKKYHQKKYRMISRNTSEKSE